MPSLLFRGFAVRVSALALTILILALPASAGASGYSHEELLSKQARFARMRTTGIVMGVAGVGMIILGSILVGTAEYETTTDYYGNEQRITNDPQWPIGFLTIVAGVPVGIAGIVLGGIGNHKVQQYEAILNSVSIRIDPRGKKAELAYSF